MSKNIFIFNSEIFWSPHLGTELEIIQNHLDKGDNISAFVCNEHFGTCEMNLEGSAAKCKLCVKKRKSGFALIKPNVTEIPIIYGFKSWIDLSVYSDIEEIKSINHNGFDVGMAVASSLISRLEDSDLNVEENFDAIESLTNNAISLYEFFLKELKNKKANLVYLFNGRLVYDRPLLRACQKLGIEYRVFERTLKFKKYAVYNNMMIHDYVETQKSVDVCWENSILSEPRKKEVAIKFYEAQRYGGKEALYFFQRNNTNNHVAKYMDSGKQNVAIYLSSNYEYSALTDQWSLPFGASQLESLIKLIEFGKGKMDEVNFIIRMHPNNLAKDMTFTNGIKNLSQQGITIISSEDNVNSYDLMEAVDKVISFGSTMGMEASYYNKPSINLGKGFHFGKGIAYEPTTLEDAFNLITQKNLPVLSNDFLLKYAFFRETFGIDYKYYGPISLSNGKFKGIDLDSLIYSPEIKAIQNLVKLARRVKSKLLRSIGSLLKFSLKTY